MISQRTKDALKAKKDRGDKLGSARPGHWDNKNDKRLVALKKGRTESIKTRSKAAIDAYSDLLPVMQSMRSEGKSLQDIAKALNDEKETTRTGKPWNPTQIMRVLDRASNN